MRPRALSFAVLIAVLAVCLAPPAVAQSGPEVVDACNGTGLSDDLCRGLESILRTVGAVCRDFTGLDVCDVIDGRDISPQSVTAHEHSWLARALSMQRDLDDTRPLQDEVWVHTHNSFNGDAYPFTFYGIDPNQLYTITDQLRMGVRAVELDVHWAESIKGDPAHGFNSLLVCHGNPEKLGAGIVHTGCGVNDREFGEYLADIKAWMDDHPDEVLMLYIENELEADPYAHALAAKELERVFGSLIYRPKTNCAPLPFDTSRKQIRDSGARIIVTGNCGVAGNVWGTLVHLRGPRWIEGTLGYGNDFPAYPCTAERKKDDYAHKWIRRYADETGLSQGTGGGGDVTPTDALNETRCGVNMIGFDNLVPFDERLQQVVWSWAPNEPANAASDECASHGADGRFHSEGCGTHRRFTCFDGTWHVTKRAGRPDEGLDACTAEHLGRFSVPWNGYENERLKDAKRSAHATTVWLNYRTSPSGGRWVPSGV